jgi:transposase
MAKQKQWKERPVTNGCPSDISDEEWSLAAPYLTLMDEEAPQREYALHDVFNGLRWIHVQARRGA